MEVREYGQENKQVVMLLHGGGLSWWNYKDVAALLQNDYHVVIPLLDGHAGSDRHFSSIEDAANALCRYIGECFGGNILAIGGLSLGGQILVEMLSQVPDICTFALIESALVRPLPSTNKMVGSAVGMSYGLIRKRWFAKLQFNELRIKPDLFEEYYQDTCKIKKEDMIAFLESNSSYTCKPSLKNTLARVAIVVGEKEQRSMQESAQILHAALPQSSLHVLKGYYHGDLSINHASKYVELLKSQLLNGSE